MAPEHQRCRPLPPCCPTNLSVLPHGAKWLLSPSHHFSEQEGGRRRRKTCRLHLRDVPPLLGLGVFINRERKKQSGRVSNCWTGRVGPWASLPRGVELVGIKGLVPYCSMGKLRLRPRLPPSCPRALSWHQRGRPSLVPAWPQRTLGSLVSLPQPLPLPTSQEPRPQSRV